MITRRIGTGDCFIQEDPAGANRRAQGRVDRVWTDGIGDCVAVAVHGDRETGERGTCLAHLHSGQYLTPTCGGRYDQESPTIRRLKRFIAEHPVNRQAVAATNWDHDAWVLANLNARYRLGLPELKRLKTSGNYGTVTLDVDRFELYAAPPDAIAPSNAACRMPSVADVIAKRRAEADARRAEAAEARRKEMRKVGAGLAAVTAALLALKVAESAGLFARSDS